jgi:hypothetical protein
MDELQKSECKPWETLWGSLPATKSSAIPSISREPRRSFPASQERVSHYCDVEWPCCPHKRHGWSFLSSCHRMGLNARVRAQVPLFPPCNVKGDTKGFLLSGLLPRNKPWGGCKAGSTRLLVSSVLATEGRGESFHLVNIQRIRLSAGVPIRESTESISN